MNLNPETEEDLLLSFAEGFEDRILDDESETITLNENQSFYVRSYTNLVEWSKSLGSGYGKPLTTDKQYKIPGYEVMRKKKGKELERERDKHQKH